MKYYIKEIRYGKYCRYEVQRVSDDKAERLEAEGIKTYSSRTEADSEKRKLK